MKTMKRKPVKFLLAISLVVLGTAMLFAMQSNRSVVASADELSTADLSTASLIYHNSSALEIIATIEEDLQEQGTSILAELYKQRDFYLVRGT